MDENEVIRVKQDLTWLMTSPPLLVHPALRWRPAEAFTPDLPDRIPADRLTGLAKLRHGRLGAYFEALATTLFEQSPAYSILARNRIIQGADRTLGELDLLLADHREERVLHLELALKFYLKLDRDDTESSPDHLWIGPGQRDFLTLKHDRLVNHQLKLPGLARANRAWPSDVPQPDASLAWVTGRLFHRQGTPFKTPQVAADAHSGYWITYREFNARGFKGQWISKADWLSPDVGHPVAPIKHPLPGQFYGVPSDETQARHWFILPDDWPSSARDRMLARFQTDEEINTGD